MPRHILGIDMNDVSTSACLARGGELVAAAQEERFSREKQTRRFPVKAIAWCLESNGLKLEDLDAVGVSVNPAIYLEHLNRAHSERARYRGELLYSTPNFLLGVYQGMAGGNSRLTMETEGGKPLEIYYIRHHDAHAAAAYYPSPFDEAAILTADAFGEKETTVWHRGAGGRIERLRAVEFPCSIGCFYAAMTEFLGFRPFHEEWKLMGASAYGDPGRFFPALSSLLNVDSDGGLFMDLAYFNHYQFHRPNLFSPKLVELLGEPYREDSERDERFFDLAAATQFALERVMFDLLGRFQKETGLKNLCLAGGVAMNCVLNGKIHEETPFENVFIPPAPDDSGTSVGAALAAGRLIDPGVSTPAAIHNNLGPEYDDGQIEEVLKLAKAPYKRTAKPAQKAAELLSGGRIVGWFQGRMEFGERALGNRSILADPREPGMKDKLNDFVKFREPFRPFAPAVLDAHQADWFDCAAHVYFMEKAFRVREEMRGRIPAVVHEDGSARLQTVTRKSNPLFYELIEAFQKLTGVPLVLNTSFNLRGEPIVMTPRDALRTFYSCGMDDLIIGSFHLAK
ncbi:MAG: carbamoyltransferase C-terminal domain-containing protein [bacterium]